jgi:hypothetical protein
MLRYLIPFLGLASLACGAGNVLSVSTPLAHFVVVSKDSNESCSKLLDYCLRVSCQIANDSVVPGQAVVDIQLLDKDGTVLHTNTERVDVGPGDTKTVTHDFTEAKIFGRDSQFACAVR